MEFKGTKGERKVRFMNPDGSETDNNECNMFVEAIEPKNHIGKIEILMDDFGEHSGYSREQKLADAYLDAAAAELLEACQKALEMCVKTTMPHEDDLLILRGRLVLAINKALGNESK